ncbi:AraC family transcriptional regulator [Burkholderiaceae bacterium DAT-1]|nr:AraC family transcriptional regulator [Burkholderiaceae bacterium DAT-1]
MMSTPVQNASSEQTLEAASCLPPAHSSSGNPVDPRIERALLEITRHFREPLSLNSLALSAGLSPYHFHRLFLAAMGDTPMAYLRRVRVLHADHLLAALPDASLLSIALESGFSSAACFSRAYRQVFGQTPSDVRNSLIRHHPAKSTYPSSPLQLYRMPTRHLRVTRHLLDDAVISEALCSMASKNYPPDEAIIGIFADAPFHVPPSDCRYFLAWTSDTGDECEQDVLTLPGGDYVRMVFTGPTVDQGNAVFAFHDTVLLPSEYALASTLFFERLSPSQSGAWHYADCTRVLFFKVRRKGEPVL